MKLVTIVFLILGLLSSSTLAVAEGPVPFSAYEQAAGSSTSVPPMPAANSDSAAANSQSTHPGSMITGGKVMTGVGIGLLGIGAVLIGIGASINKNAIAGPEARSIGIGAGAGTAGIGAVLIIVGTHKRKAK